MAAFHTLSHPPAVPQISKLGVLTLYGYGIRVTMQAGHLQVEDGIGPERRRFRLPRVNHRLKRLVCIGEDGFITFSALKWLSDVKASFVMLDRLGKIRIVTGPSSPSEARLRRAQALALGNGTGTEIARKLISVKLQGQEMLVREKLHNVGIADLIAALRARLPDAADMNAIRGIEGRAAAEYWNAFRDLPVLFPWKDSSRIPAHWLRFGTRHSPLTGGPRLAVNPVNSLLNYVNAVAESECRLAARACGLDAGLGFLHTDTANRASLALDLIETIRPAIEAWLLDWLMREPLRRADFSEHPDGNCRISAGLCSKLSETAPTWGKLVAPWAEFVAHSLLRSRKSATQSVHGFKTPLTQIHRREAKGASAPKVNMPKPEGVCRGCGTQAPRGQHCPKCGREISAKRLIELAKIGRTVALRPESRKKRSQTQKRHHAARKAWRSTPNLGGLDERKYIEEIQPRLRFIPISKIAVLMGVSAAYAADVRKGKYRPHQSHWGPLAELAGISGGE